MSSVGGSLFWGPIVRITNLDLRFLASHLRVGLFFTVRNEITRLWPPLISSHSPVIQSTGHA